MPTTVRLAAIQSNRVPSCEGLKTRGDEAYWEYLYSGVLGNPHPPLADQYPEGGLAETPEAIAEVYRKRKEAHLKSLRGEPVPYHWRW